MTASRLMITGSLSMQNSKSQFQRLETASWFSDFYKLSLFGQVPFILKGNIKQTEEKSHFTYFLLSSVKMSLQHFYNEDLCQ